MIPKTCTFIIYQNFLGGKAMRRFFLALLAVLSISMPILSSDSGSIGTGFFGAGFDEGLLLRVQITEKISSYLGVGYYVKGADTVYRQPINRFSWKLGGEYTIKSFDKLKINSFAEWREEINQKETERAAGASTLRYNQFNTIFRIGLRPEWFILDRLSIDYKFGIQYTHFSNTYKLNTPQTGLESNKDAHDEFGVYSGRAPFFNEPSLLLNIGMTIYIGKLPFFFK
jgi:hypothetical protein